MWKKIADNQWIADIGPMKLILNREDTGEFNGWVEFLQAEFGKLIDRRSTHGVVGRSAGCRKWNHLADHVRPKNRVAYAMIEVTDTARDWLAEISRTLENHANEEGAYEE